VLANPISRKIAIVIPTFRDTVERSSSHGTEVDPTT
jgi:hypothetical protein